MRDPGRDAAAHDGNDPTGWHTVTEIGYNGEETEIVIANVTDMRRHAWPTHAERNTWAMYCRAWSTSDATAHGRQPAAGRARTSASADDPALDGLLHRPHRRTGRPAAHLARMVAPAGPRPPPGRDRNPVLGNRPAQTPAPASIINRSIPGKEKRP